MCGETFSDELAMPVRHRHVFRMFRNMIPEGLNVIELLLCRELVKAGRRKDRL
jgi:hypothetical protein